MKTADQPFEFQDPGTLRDGELELHLVETRPANPTYDLLPAYLFEMRVDGRKVGGIDLRIGNTHRIVTYSGHIGYSVLPKYRGHHYAERACRLLFALAKAHGLTTLWITCNPGNIPSRRTCERLGGTLVEIVDLPKENDQYLEGDRKKCRYRIDLGT